MYQTRMMSNRSQHVGLCNVTTCVICWEKIDKEFCLPCNHAYCTDCLKTWFQSENALHLQSDDDDMSSVNSEMESSVESVSFYDSNSNSNSDANSDANSDSISISISNSDEDHTLKACILHCPMCRRPINAEVIPYQWYHLIQSPTLTVLEKLTEERLSMNKEDIIISFSNYGSTERNTIQCAMKYAILHGHDQIFEWWLKKLQLPLATEIEFCEYAIRKNKLKALELCIDHSTRKGKLLRYLISQCFDHDLNNKSMYEFERMSLDIYNYLYNKSVGTWTPHIIAIIISYIDDDVEKLEWWRNRIPLYHLQSVFVAADTVAMLEFWKNISPKAYSEADIEDIIDQTTDVDQLQWWKTNLRKEGRQFKFTNLAILNAIRKNKMDTLKWWDKSGFPILMSISSCVDEAQTVEALIWIHGHQHESMHYLLPSILMRCCIQYDGDNVVLPLTRQEAMMQFCVDRTEGVHRKHIFISCAADCLAIFSRRGHIAQLEWWKNSKLPMLFEDEFLDLASENGHIAVLDWWELNYMAANTTCNSLLFSEYALKTAIQNGHGDVIQWWYDRWQTGTVPLRFSMKFGESYNDPRIEDMLNHSIFLAS